MERTVLTYFGEGYAEKVQAGHVARSRGRNKRKFKRAPDFHTWITDRGPLTDTHNSSNPRASPLEWRHA